MSTNNKAGIKINVEMNIDTLAIFNKLVQFILLSDASYFDNNVYFEKNTRSGFYYIACDDYDPFTFACKGIDDEVSIIFYDNLIEQEVIVNDYNEAQAEYNLYLQREEKEYEDEQSLQLANGLLFIIILPVLFYVLFALRLSLFWGMLIIKRRTPKTKQLLITIPFILIPLIFMVI
jgi:hypothetical protein